MSRTEQNVILISADSNILYENYQKTVQSQVEPGIWKKKLPRQIRSQSSIAIWGLNPTRENERIWQNLRRGDLALFFRKGKYFSKGVIQGTLKDIHIPPTLWKDELFGRSWHLLIFLNNIRPFDLDFESSIPFFINPTMPNAFAFPIIKVDADKRDLLVSTFGSIDRSLADLRALQTSQEALPPELYSTKIPHETRVELFEVLAKQRRGQEQFRRNVLLNYHNSCAVCPIDDETLLEASHIVPVADQKLAGLMENGICLCPIHHVMFDKGYFSINNEYKVIISKKKSFTKGVEGLIVEGRRMNKPRLLPSRNFLSVHRLRFGFQE